MQVNTSSHLGVLGIVASRLVERFHAPVIVVTDDPREPGTLAGSGRSIPEFHLLEALDEMADLFIAYGGHRQAASVRLRSKRLDEFRSRFAEYASQRLGNEQRIPRHHVDAEVSFSDLTAEVAEGIQSLGPFGCGNPAPVLLARNLEVADCPIRVITPGRHFSIPLRQSACELSCKAWNFSDQIQLFKSDTPVDILFNIDDDRYAARRGYKPWAVTIRGVRLASRTSKP